MATVDLTINRLNVYPEPLEAGESFFIDYSLYNYSFDVPRGDVRVDFYLSSNSTITNNDYLLGTDYITPGDDLAGGATEIFSISTFLPNINDSFWNNSENYYIGAIVTPSSLDFETDFSDNNSILSGDNQGRNSDEVEVYFPVSDLTIDQFEINPDNLTAGESFTVNFDLFNNSSFSSGNFDVRFYLYEDGNSFYLGQYNVNNIAENTIIRNLNKTLTLPNASNLFWTGSGNYDILMIVDESNQVPESEENNNSASVEIAISILPDLEGKFFNITPEPLTPGAELNLNFAISNNSSTDAGNFDVEFYLSLDDNITTSDFYLNSYNISSLGGNDTASNLTKSLVLPEQNHPFWQGSNKYYIGMVIDSQNTIPEYDENNNSSRTLISDYDDIIISFNQKEPSANSQVNTPIYRFQNTEQPGTYIFVGESERQSIQQNFDNFEEEGFAFAVGVQPGDDLLPLYRFQNRKIPGTYLFVGESERQSINNSNYTEDFIEEGLAFYVYNADYDLGTVFYRLQNRDLPGTYIYASPEERDSILGNFPNFLDEGEAFGVEI